MPRVSHVDFESSGRPKKIPLNFRIALVAQFAVSIYNLLCYVAYTMAQIEPIYPRQGALAADVAAPLALMSCVYFGYVGLLRVYTRVTTLSNVMLAQTLYTAFGDLPRYRPRFVAYAILNVLGMLLSMWGVWLARREAAKVRAMRSGANTTATVAAADADTAAGARKKNE